jgi:hypothetical protein
MKLLILGLTLCLVLLPGCARRYDITLRNGQIVRATTKPVLNENGFYEFKNLSGQESQIGMGRVRQIAPATWRRTVDSSK